MQVDDTSIEAEAVCPACRSRVCITCHVLWHEGNPRRSAFLHWLMVVIFDLGYSCEEYQVC